MCEAHEVKDAPSRKRVLVTGASSGIGAAFAAWYSKQGYDVVLVGRDTAALELVALSARSCGVTTETLIADLSHKDGVDRVAERCGVLDAVVCNAGVTHVGAVGTSDRDHLDELAYLMSAGVVRLCEQVVPAMLTRGTGDVIIVSSIASFTPMRKASAYAAAKSHATAYARSLALELSNKGVRVVAVCPGYVRTDLHRRAGLDHLSRNVPEWMWLTPEDVVDSAQRALHKGRVVVVPGLVYRLVLPFLSSPLAQGAWRRLTRRR